MTDKPKRGRPAKRTMPAPIPDTPESIAAAIVTSPPKAKTSGATSKTTRYLQDDDGG